MGKGTSGGDGLDKDDSGSHRGSTRFLKGRVRVREVRTQGRRNSVPKCIKVREVRT